MWEEALEVLHCLLPVQKLLQQLLQRLMCQVQQKRGLLLLLAAAVGQGGAGRGAQS